MPGAMLGLTWLIYSLFSSIWNSLRLLDLSYNELTSLSEAVLALTWSKSSLFSSISNSLCSLDLSYNELTRLPGAVLALTWSISLIFKLNIEQHSLPRSELHWADQWPACLQLSWLGHDLFPFQLNIEQPALARPELQWADQLACSCSG
jgi:hypothetical protein